MFLVQAVFAVIAFISSPDAAEGIISGEYAKDGQFPISVVILQEGDVLCGGVLVTSQHVFTACHCVGQFGKIEDVTDIDWEPLETGYTINVTFDDSMWSTERYSNETFDEDSAERDVAVDDDNLMMEDLQDVKASDYEDENASRVSSTSTSSLSIASDNRTSSVHSAIIAARYIADSTSTSNPTFSELENSTDIREGFIPYDLTNILLVAGTIWIYRFGNGQVREPSSSFQHPSCNNKTTPWDFDFGVYQCKGFYLNNFLMPMTLWYLDREIMRKRFNEMINDGAMCTTVGWGATRKPDSAIPPSKNSSEKLKTTQVKLVADSLCNELLCRHPYWFCKGRDFPWSDRGIVCATHVSRGDSCSEDDGNALICDDHVVGFANSGVDCFGGFPRFYTRLDYATDFYHSTVSSPSSRIRLEITLSHIVFIIKILNVYRMSPIYLFLDPHIFSCISYKSRVRIQVPIRKKL